MRRPLNVWVWSVCMSDKGRHQILCKVAWACHSECLGAAGSTPVRSTKVAHAARRGQAPVGITCMGTGSEGPVPHAVTVVTQHTRIVSAHPRSSTGGVMDSSHQPPTRPPWFISKYSQPLRRVMRLKSQTQVTRRCRNPLTVSYDVLACGHVLQAHAASHNGKAPRWRRCRECIKGA
jgi:hypothetical protein